MKQMYKWFQAVPVTATDRDGMYARSAPSRHLGLATGNKIAFGWSPVKFRLGGVEVEAPEAEGKLAAF
jgi:hypothetical protein